MSAALLAQARASLPPTAKPWQIADALRKLTDAQWIADGRRGSMQMAQEAWPAASEAYERSLLSRLGPEQYAEIVAARAEAATELDQQNEAAA